MDEGPARSREEPGGVVGETGALRVPRDAPAAPLGPPAAPLGPPAAPPGPPGGGPPVGHPARSEGRHAARQGRALVAGRGDLVAALAVTAGLAALGIPLGWLWSTLAPHVEVVVRPLGPDLVDYQTEAFIGADAIFALVGAGTGLLTGAGAWLVLRPWRGPLLALALALGSLAGAWVAMRTGQLVGAAAYDELVASASEGRTFPRPVDVRATGVLLVQAAAAVITYVVVAGWSRFPDLDTGVLPLPGPPVPGPPVPSSPPPAWQPGRPGPAGPVSSGSAAPGAPPAAPAPPAGDAASSPPA